MQSGNLYEKFFDSGKRDLPYASEREYHNDLCSMLDIYVSASVQMKEEMAKGRSGVDHEALYQRGVAVEAGVVRMEYARHRMDARDDCIEETVRNTADAARLHIRTRLLRTGDRLFLRYQYLVELVHMSEWEQFLFLIAFSAVHHTRYEAAYSYLQGGIRFPTLRLAMSLYRLARALPEQEAAKSVEKQGVLMQYLLETPETEEYQAASFALILRERVWAFLGGYDGVDQGIARIAELSRFQEKQSPLLIRGQYKTALKGYLLRMLEQRESRGQVLQIYGPDGIGRRSLLRSVASEMQVNLLFVDAAKLLSGNVEELLGFLKRILLESILQGALICFCGYETPVPEVAARGAEPVTLRFLMEAIRTECSVCVWLGREKAEFLLNHGLHVLYMELPMLSAGEREHLWREYTMGSGAPFETDGSVDPRLEANRYILTPQSLREVLWDAKIHAACERRSISSRDIRKAVECQSGNQLGASATKIRSVYGWSDLIIGDKQRRQMEHICNQVKYRSIVGEQWGFHRKTSYGRGVSALFYGAPGTGKTMAVQVIANELGLELYRIDLSQIVSKYIGETEKNISDLFHRAKHMNALLFFDEADSLFAKRLEVKDAHDRNANAETAHLLQKLEDYEGISILATNYVNNIDEAFKRRIRYMVNFVFPAPDVRLELWRTILPEETPLAEKIDIEFFAEKFELSGSGIKEILTNAAYMAAAEGSGLRNSDVAEAVRLHFSKYGKILGKAELKYLEQA